jgi:hypothetical protein
MQNLQATTDRDSNADIGPIQLESENIYYSGKKKHNYLYGYSTKGVA